MVSRAAGSFGDAFEVLLFGISSVQVVSVTKNKKEPDSRQIEKSREKYPGTLMYIYCLIKTFFASVKKRRASHPPSRPTPEAFIPPKGVRRSRTSHELSQTIPLCN